MNTIEPIFSLSKRIFKLYRLQQSRRSRRRDSVLSKVAEKKYTVLWSDESKADSRICYFSSFDKDGIVDAHVFHYLRELYSNGFSVIFVTTSCQIKTRDQDRLRDLTKAIIHRENLGHDFFSWKIGLKLFPPHSSTERVLFANDSVYGPAFPLGYYIDKMEMTSWEMVGMTDSWERRYHVQSYFLYCKSGIIRSGFLERFFGNVRVISDKAKLVELYEMGFSRQLLVEGFDIGALIDYRALFRNFALSVPAIDIKYINDPTMFFWEIILSQHLSPFIKKGIFARLDKKAVLLSASIEDELLKANSNLSYSIIGRHLQRVFQSETG